MLDFSQARELVETAIDNYNEEIMIERFIHTYEPRGMTYDEFKKSLKTPKKEDHRCAAEILDETAALFAAAGW